MVGLKKSTKTMSGRIASVLIRIQTKRLCYTCLQSPIACRTDSRGKPRTGAAYGIISDNRGPIKHKNKK
jgi:hypothetical protein